jgi:hypothetical protein
MKGSTCGLPCLDRHLSGVERAMPFSGTWSIAALLFEMRAGTHMAYGLLFGKFSYTQYTPPEEFVAMNFCPSRLNTRVYASTNEVEFQCGGIFR